MMVTSWIATADLLCALYRLLGASRPLHVACHRSVTQVLCLAGDAVSGGRHDIGRVGCLLTRWPRWLPHPVRGGPMAGERVRVEVVRTGGFAGIRRTGTID